MRNFRYFLIRFGRVTLIFFVLLFLVALIFITWVDRTDPANTSYFKDTILAIDSTNLPPTRLDSVGVGWSKINLTPSRVLPLAGYGGRKDKRYTAVHDSIYVRTMVFQNDQSTYAVVTADLLIFPPEVVKAINKLILPSGLDQANIYYTATHTHSSIGSWQPGLVGDLFAGSYDTTVINFIASKVVQSFHSAMKDVQPTRFGYVKVDNGDHVRNRIVGKKGLVDPWLRVLKMERMDGSLGYFFSYAAHATCLTLHSNDLSGDYPGKVMYDLENDDQIQFAAFAAGSVGSMSPEAPGLRGYEKLDHVAAQLTDQINLIGNMIQTEPYGELVGEEFPLDLGEPQFKIAKNFRARPWVFNKLFGAYKVDISTLQLGDILLVGLPCDFSGELAVPLDSIADANGLNLMITSFNGGYAGYITRDDWYDLPRTETRMMNWYGPGNGSYLSEVTKKLIIKYANNTSDTTAK